MTDTSTNGESERLSALDSFQILDTPPEERFDRLTRLASKLFGVPIALVSLVDAERQWFKSKVGLCADETPRELAFCHHTIAQDSVMVVPDASDDPRFMRNPFVAGDPLIRFYAGAPLKDRDGYNLGTLCIIDREPRNFEAEQCGLLSDLAALVVTEMELRRQDFLDRLTGTFNRRRFLEVALEEVLRARRYGQELSLVVADIDQLKQINDRYGYDAGDQVLMNIAALCRHMLRRQDYIGRLDGEEFGWLLPHTGPAGAGEIAARISQVASKLKIRHDGNALSISVSMGIAGLRSDDNDADRLLRRAYQALADAKSSGANKISLAEVA